MNDKITLYQKKRLEKTSFSALIELKLAEAEKILFVTERLKITGTEQVEGEIRVMGRIDYTVVFTSADGVDSASTGKDFLEKIGASGVLPESEVFVFGEVENTEWIEGETLRLKSDVALCGWYIQKETFSCYDGEGAEKYVETVVKDSVVALPDTDAEIAKDFEIVGGIEKILSYSTSIKVTSVVPDAGVARVDGEADVNLIYLHDGKVFSESLSLPFAHEIVGDEINAESRMSVYPTVSNGNVTLGEGESVLIELELKFRSAVTNDEEIEVLKDAFVLGKETVLTESVYSLTRTRCAETITEKVGDSVRLETVGRTVVAVTPPTVSGLHVAVKDNRTLVAEGVVGSRVIYLAEDGRIMSALVEIPFQGQGGRDCAGVETITAEATVNSYYAKLRMNDEIEFNASVSVRIEGMEVIPLKAVTGLTVVGDADDQATVSLYIVNEGDTLFSVAKSLLTSEDVILFQNENLELPLQKGAQVIVYREL